MKCERPTCTGGDVKRSECWGVSATLSEAEGADAAGLNTSSEASCDNDELRHDQRSLLPLPYSEKGSTGLLCGQARVLWSNLGVLGNIPQILDVQFPEYVPIVRTAAPSP
mmetsp:Transcript_4920/g.8107  ORF Transcript_4920/g.8107 Transcript_4920/m.8107 type:complete len:110 (+) Transcript_4920:840-1169(+)